MLDPTPWLVKPESHVFFKKLREVLNFGKSNEKLVLIYTSTSRFRHFRLFSNNWENKTLSSEIFLCIIFKGSGFTTITLCVSDANFQVGNCRENTDADGALNDSQSFQVTQWWWCKYEYVSVECMIGLYLFIDTMETRFFLATLVTGCKTLTGVVMLGELNKLLWQDLRFATCFTGNR